MKGRALAMAGLMVLAGCIGGGSADEPVRKARVEIGGSSGAVTGVVTDIAVQPIVGAVVAVVELSLRTITELDGSYAINNVPPGSYNVEVVAAGFVPAAIAVEVRAGEATLADLVLAPIVSQVAFTEVFELNGFVECSVVAGWNQTATLRGPLGSVDEVVNGTAGTDPNMRRYSSYYNGLAVCAVPNTVQENTTNDRFIHYFDLQPPIGGLVYELSWRSNSAMSDWMLLISGVPPFWNNRSVETVRDFGTSPIVKVVQKERFDAVAAELLRKCEEEDNTEACGMNPRDSGWPMATRLFAAYQCAGEAAGACGPFQQDFTILVTAYYNQPLPSGATNSTTIPG